MNIKIFSLSIAFIAGASCIQEASAQESRGARFNFAPNTWKTEQPHTPNGYNQGPAHAVRSGAVPNANTLLGFDPNTLQPAPPPPPPRVAPIAQPSVQARPSSSRVAGTYNPKPSFSPSFGAPAPMNTTPVQPFPVAHAPTMTPPVQPVPPVRPSQPLVAKAPGSVGRASTGHRRWSSTGVAGRLATRPKPSGAAAAPPQALSYDKGYVPGGSIAAGSASGVGRSDTAVSGRLLSKNNHKR